MTVGRACHICTRTGPTAAHLCLATSWLTLLDGALAGYSTGYSTGTRRGTQGHSKGTTGHCPGCSHRRSLTHSALSLLGLCSVVQRPGGYCEYSHGVL